MKYSLFVGALLLTYCALCCAADSGDVTSPSPDGDDTPPTNVKVERLIAQEFGDYGVVMDERRPVVLTCTAEGRPEPTFRWKVNESAVDTSDPRITDEGGVLTIDAPTTADEGEFQCFATNQYGTAMSSKYQTVYAYQDQFQFDLDRTWEFNEGDEALVKCTPPDGAPKPNVYWSVRNPDRMETDNRVTYTEKGNLFFSNILKSDAGRYWCVAANIILGTIRSSPIHAVTVNSGTANPRAAKIKELAGNQVAVEGLRTQEFVIKCVASGFPTPTISWFKDDVEITSTADVTIENYDQELKFTSLGFYHAGTYECRASNEASTSPATKEVRLDVASAPYFGTEPADIVLPPGGTGQITCDARGVPVPDYVWLQNGAPIQDSADSPYHVNDKTINIVNPMEGESTVFQCVLNNKHGEKLGSYTITILAIPATVSEKPTPYVVTSEGSVLRLSCATFGSPDPTVAWEKNGVPITPGGRFTITEVDGGKNSTLTVTELVFNDGGRYTCHALNSFGNSSASSTVLIRYQVPTDAELTPEVQTVHAGSTVDFTCEITKDRLASPTTTWFFDGNEIHPNRQRNDYTLLSENQLQIRSAKLCHTGTFMCVATTPYDSDNSTAQLTVQAVPDPPYNVIVEIVGVQANLQWTEPNSNNAEISTYTIEWRTQYNSFPEPENSSLAPWDKLREVSASSTSETIQLGSYLEYSFRVIATNEVGNSQRSEVVTGPRTAPAPPNDNSMPSNVQSEASEPGKLTITWDEVHPYYHNGPNFQYVIKWKPEGETEWRYEYIDDYKQTSLEIEADEYQNIEYSVGVKNAENDGPEAVMHEETTGQGEPSAAPGNVQLEVLGSNEIRVTWDPVPEEDINGALLQYNVYYTIVNAQGSTKVEECPPLENSCVVGGLEAFTTYSVEVAVVNQKYTGPKSTPVTIKTAEGKPSIANIENIESTSYRIAVTWSPPAKANGIHIGYLLQIVPSKGDEIGNPVNETVDDIEQTMFKMGAEPDTTYEVTLTAYTSVGHSEPSKGSSTTGVAGEPPAPGKPKLDDASDKHLNVTWLPVSKNDPRPDRVRACYKVKDAEEECKNTEWVDVLEDDLIFIQSLEKGTEYVVFLEFKNEEGGKTGPTAIFTTTGTEEVVKPDSALKPWFIIVICVIVLLLLILLIICILKSQKGGKYNVSDKENALKDENAPLKNNDGFAEFNNDSEFPDDMEGSQDSLASNPDDDGDSLKEYADDEDPSKFNEDGSFVEEYHDPKPRSTDVREGGTSTFV